MNLFSVLVWKTYQFNRIIFEKETHPISHSIKWKPNSISCLNNYLISMYLILTCFTLISLRIKQNDNTDEFLENLTNLSSIRRYLKSLYNERVLFDIIYEIKSIQTDDLLKIVFAFSFFFSLILFQLNMLHTDNMNVCHTVSKTIASLFPLFNLCYKLLDTDTKLKYITCILQINILQRFSKE